MGTKRPRSLRLERGVERSATDCRSAEAVFERRENARSPGQAAQSPDSAGRPRSESCGSEPGTREVRVHVSRTGGRSRLDASRVLLAGRSQGLVAGQRALAGRKLEAPPDAGHEQREGELVRVGTRFPITGTRAIGLWVSARRLTIRRKAFSGTHASGLHRQGAQGPSARRSSCVARSARNAPLGAHRAVRRPTRACLRVTKRMSEVDTVRSRLHEVREGPRGVRILGAEKASVEWCT